MTARANETNDKTFAEVDRRMAAWLAENDPYATPITDVLRCPTALRGDAARVERLFGDYACTFMEGFAAGMEFARANPEP